MANFFTDNEDIQFLFDHIDLAETAAVQEDDFTRNNGAGSEYAPVGADDAIDNYRRILEIVG
ncbi:MAG: acyl-CoA dehydrogenase family protein, partial [Planctomycetota bacterium]